MAVAGLAAMAQYTIYPVPQKMQATEGTAQFSDKVCLVCDEGIDAATIERAQQVLADHGLQGSLTSGQEQCTSLIRLKIDPSVAVSKKFDAHTLTLAAMSNGMVELTITGQHTDAVFYGLATLEQMLDQASRSSMPCVSIHDWADQQQRGLVEGYYGYPYSVDVKKDLMRFMMRMKMNTYLYGAKSDPYHSTYWKDAYPTSVTAEQEEGGWLSQDMLRDICQVSHETKVNFIWAIHPGNAFVSSTSVVNDIMSKFQKMHELGVRQFAVFVDDVGIPSSDDDMKTNADHLTALQQAIEKKFNTATAAPTDTVRPLHFVPQIYCRGFAGSEDQFQRFFRALAATPKHIVVYTTGWGVWSVPNVNDFNNTAQHLGREVAWWWNYPCNDNSDGQIYPMDMYQNFVDLPQIDGNSRLPSTMQNRGMGIVSNPMQQGEVAKTALFSVADYAWHCAGFVNAKSWEASFPFVVSTPELAAAYRTLAPYLTNNDPTTGITASLSAAQGTKKIEPLLQAAETLLTLRESDSESDRLLYNDLRPWLLKLHQMLLATKGLYAASTLPKTTEDGSLNAEKWNTYVEALLLADELDTNPDFFVNTLDGKNYQQVSTKKVIPSNRTLGATLEALRTSAIKGFVPTRTTRAKYVTNIDYTGSVSTASDLGGAYYLAASVRPYEPMQYAGMTMPDARPVSIMVQDTLLQGRTLWVSADAKEWTELHQGEQPEGPVRHILVVNTSSERQYTKFSKAVLSVLPMQEPTIDNVTLPAGNEYGGHEKKYLTDGDYSTWFTMNANQKNGDAYTLQLSHEAPLSIVRVVIGTTNNDYMTTGRIEISTDGEKWTRLSPIGTTKTTFGIDDMQKLTDESRTLDFDAKGQMARYVRLYNQTANTSKWLRIYELQPIYAVKLPEATDAKGYALWEATDGQANTYSVPQGKSMQVYLQQMNDVESLTILTDGGIDQVDLSSEPRLPFYTYSWTSSKPLKVFEVIVNTTDTHYDPTGVVPLTLPEPSHSGSAHCYDLYGRLLSRMPQTGISIQGGKKIIR